MVHCLYIFDDTYDIRLLHKTLKSLFPQIIAARDAKQNETINHPGMPQLRDQGLSGKCGLIFRQYSRRYIANGMMSR